MILALYMIPAPAMPGHDDTEVGPNISLQFDLRPSPLTEVLELQWALTPPPRGKGGNRLVVAELAVAERAQEIDTKARNPAGKISSQMKHPQLSPGLLASSGIDSLSHRVDLF